MAYVVVLLLFFLFFVRPRIIDQCEIVIEIKLLFYEGNGREKDVYCE